MSRAVSPPKKQEVLHLVLFIAYSRSQCLCVLKVGCLVLSHVNYRQHRLLQASSGTILGCTVKASRGTILSTVHVAQTQRRRRDVHAEAHNCIMSLKLFCFIGGKAYFNLVSKPGNVVCKRNQNNNPRNANEVAR